MGSLKSLKYMPLAKRHHEKMLHSLQREGNTFHLDWSPFLSSVEQTVFSVNKM